MKSVVMPLAIAAVLIAPAQAAQITYKEVGKDVNIIISGEIKKDDYDAFNRMYDDIKKLKNDSVTKLFGDTNKRIVVELRSEGGSFMNGLAIAEIIHDDNLTTWVPKDTLCASVCAVMWLAGNQRYATSTSLIGFHAVYNVDDEKASGTGNAFLGSYLGKWGFDLGFIEFTTVAGANDIRYLTVETARKYAVKYSGDLPTDNYIQHNATENPETASNSPEHTNGGLWATYITPNACLIKTQFRDGRIIGLSVLPDGVFAVIAKPSWRIPTGMQVAAKVWIDYYPPLSGPGLAVPKVPTAMGIRVHPQFYRMLSAQMIRGWWAYVQFTGNEPPWRVSLWGVTANWPEFEQCARRVYPPFVAQLENPGSGTQPW